MGVVLNTPEIQAVVQQGYLTRRILEGLLPEPMWRMEAGEPEMWVGNTGETRTFTSKGHAKPTAKSLVPGQDPKVIKPPGKEQWEATLRVYPDEGASDVHMVTAVNAIVNLLYEEVQTLGVHAGQSLNRLSRAPLYNAALAGHTVADGAQVATTSLRVARINGFTRARRPDLAGGSVVKYNPVSSTNPLKILVNGGANTVIAFTPDFADDEYGPGVLTLSAAVTVADRDTVQSLDRTFLHRVGGGDKIDAVSPADTLKLADIRTLITNFRRQDIKKHDTGFFHCHIDPIPQSQLFADPEFQRLTETGLAQVPDFFLFKEQVVSVGMSSIFLSNNRTFTFGEVFAEGSEVAGGPRFTYSEADPIGGETTNTGTPTGDPVHNTLWTAAGGLKEYVQSNDLYTTDAGVTGLLGDFDSALTNDSVEIRTQGVTFIMQAAKNRHADQISMAWKMVATWVFRPDGVTGSAARYKRCGVIQSG